MVVVGSLGRQAIRDSAVVRVIADLRARPATLALRVQAAFRVTADFQARVATVATRDSQDIRVIRESVGTADSLEPVVILAIRDKMVRQ